jgi:hypothetical protein
MRQILFRALIAVVVCVALAVAVPIVFSLVGLPLTGQILTLFKILGALIALGWIIWGPPVW